MQIKLLIILLGTLVLVMVFLFSNSVRIKHLSPEKFEELINREDIFLLQAHVSYYSEIERTDLIMQNWEDPSAYINELPKNKKVKIAVYCRSGRMSQITAEKLIEIGYENVYNLEGGMNFWEESGRELISNQ